MKNNAKITISVLVIFSGLCIISSTYFNTKKHEVFDDMNRLYYEQIVKLDDVEEITEEEAPVVIPDPIEEPVEEPVVTPPTTIPTNPDTPTTTTRTGYSYIGTLKIPKINLEHGFLDKNSKYNVVSKNILVHKSSDYPDVKNGNLILASHSGTSSISYFKNLYKLSTGDDVYINYNNKEYHYKVTRIYKDSKDGKVAIRRDYNKTTLTLITCTKNDKTTQTIYICELV